MWSRRGLYSADLDDMNDREADRYVKKENIWKKPDYQALIDSGIPTDVVFYMKTVRDSLGASPVYLRSDDTPEKKLARQKQYIDTVRQIQADMEQVKTKADVMNAFDKCMIENGWYDRLEPGSSGSYYATITDKASGNPAITHKLATSVMIRSEADYYSKITRPLQKTQFGIPKAEAVPRGYEIRFFDGKYAYSANNDWTPNTYYVTKGCSILKTNLETREAALQWAQAAAAQNNTRRQKFVPPQLEHIRRNGADYRQGRDMAGQDYLSAFGFRGGEFGNWLSSNERQTSLNMAYDALKDLAAALQISDRDLSYQGILAIAFGARGTAGAVAHYEPLRQVINLTKMHGAGSLAHEWWHGLDDYLGRKFGVKGLLSETPGKYPLFAKLIAAIKYKEETPEQAAKREQLQGERQRKYGESFLDSHMLGLLKDNRQALTEYTGLKAAFLRGEQDSVEKLNSFKKSICGHVFQKSDRSLLEMYCRNIAETQRSESPRIQRVETEYYKASRQMDQAYQKDGGYWQSNVEMTARAFATYVMDRLTYQSDYLVGHAECAVGFVTDKDGGISVIRAYPQGEERTAINAVFDEIISDLKLRHILTPENKPLCPGAPTLYGQEDSMEGQTRSPSGPAKKYRDAEGKLSVPLEELCRLTSAEAGTYYETGKRYAYKNREYLCERKEDSFRFTGRDGSSFVIPCAKAGTFLPDIASSGMEITRIEEPKRSRKPIEISR